MKTITRLSAAAGTLTLFTVPALVTTPAAAAPPIVVEHVAPPVAVDGTVPAGRSGLRLDGEPIGSLPVRSKRVAATATTPPVGTVRSWPAIDYNNANIYRKDYTLRGVGEKIEVWVAQDLAYPAGDCRNDVPGVTEVTDTQVQGLVQEFDTNIYPRETAAFRTPPDRDGTNARLDGDFGGAGDRTVTLVDNIKDPNYLDRTKSFLAGMFDQGITESVDRNVMSIDSYDWAHRTGADPLNDPVSNGCVTRPARPRAYEGTFAHEWQHLLQYYADPFETTWLNEGLADYAKVVVGYGDATRTVYDSGFDSHLICFQGYGTVTTTYNPTELNCGGPSNSVNLWRETDTSLLADYGNAFELLVYIKDHFGTDAVRALYNDGERQGLASLAAVLRSRGVREFPQFLHDYQTAVLTDDVLDVAGSASAGISKHNATSATLRSSINFADTNAYAAPGAPPNGADYVPLGSGADLRSISFRAAGTAPVVPLTWTTSEGALFSGDTINADASAVTPVTVPRANPTLSFQASYGADERYDYGYVIVSTDGGATYTAIKGDKTVTGPRGPGLTGHTDGFEAHNYDLSAYAGRKILLGFEYVTDPDINMGGWRIDDVTLGGKLISDGTSLAPFRSITEIKPAAAVWNLRLIGLDAERHVVLQRDFGSRDSVTLDKAELAHWRAFPSVVAVVAFDDTTERVPGYAPYTLQRNGETMPGGR